MGYLADKISWLRETATGKFLDGEIWMGRLDSSSFAAIANEHANILVTCYIDKEHLLAIAEADNRTECDILSDILPDKPNIRSGDFGEILARSILQEWKDCPKFPAQRWRNRSTKNDTVRGTDLVGYLCQSDEPNEDDLLVFCEVKTREDGGDKDVVRKAYDGVLTDNITRLTNTLYLLQNTLLRDGMGDEAKKLGRFSNPYDHPYRKRLTACIVHEQRNWNSDYLQALPENHKLPDEFVILVIQFGDLAKWIDQTYDMVTKVYE